MICSKCNDTGEVVWMIKCDNKGQHEEKMMCSCRFEKLINSQSTKDKKLETIISNVRSEFLSASNKFGKFNSYHEGYAVILEELDELWDEIKSKSYNKSNMEKESIQIAAMAIRFIYDLEE